MSEREISSRSHDERWRSAARSFEKFVPEAAPERAAASFERRLGPLGTFAFEAVGAMWDRPQLSRRDRSLLVVATLAAQARADELVAHTQIGLRHGLSRIEIEEILPMVAAYAGFPAAMAASRHVDQGLREYEGVDRLSARVGATPKDDAHRDADGAVVARRLTGRDARDDAGEPVRPADDAAELARYTDRFGHLGELAFRWAFGEVWARSELAPRDRSIVVISILVSLGTAQPLRFHLAAGRNNGLSVVEIEEVITHLAYYAGIPRAIDAMTLARDVLIDHPS